MNDIIEQLTGMSISDIYNPTSFGLYVRDSGLYCNHFISKNVIIGEITGDPKYIWDMDHQDYLIVGDEFVLDVSQQTPRSILSYIREENMTNNKTNCRIITELVNETTGDTHFYLQAFDNIYPHQELVYLLDEAYY